MNIGAYFGKSDMGRHNQGARYQGERRVIHGGHNRANTAYYDRPGYYPNDEFDPYYHLPADNYRSRQDEAMYSEAEYEKVRQHNFDVWGRWRTDMNDSILTDFITGHVRPLPPLAVALGRAHDPRDASRYDPNMLMNYSLATNSVTDLKSDSFLKYGIPRAKLNTAHPEYGHVYAPDVDRHVRVRRERGRENIYVVRP